MIKTIEQMLARIDAEAPIGEWLLLKDLADRVRARKPVQGDMSDCNWRRLWRPLAQRYYSRTREEVSGRHSEFDLSPAVCQNAAHHFEPPYASRARARLIDVAMADLLWGRSGIRIADGGGLRPKRDAIIRMILRMRKIQTPRVLILNTNEGPAIFFEDGNTRFTIIREGGAKHVRVTFETPEDLRRATEINGLIVDEPQENLVG